MRRPQQMSAFAGRRAGDPAAFSGSGGDAPIERGGKFQRHEWPAEADALQETDIEFGRLGGAQPDFDRKPGLAQRFDAGAGDARVGIFKSDHDTAQSGGDQGIGTGRRLAPMAARFEGDVCGGAMRRGAGPAHRLGFAMRPAAVPGPATADDTPVLDNDAADRRVWPDRAEAAPRQRQRGSHHRQVNRAILRGFSRGRQAGLNRHPPRSARRIRRNP